MKRAKMILKKMIHPPKWVLFLIPVVSYAALIFIFATGETESALAYPVYCMSAYSLVILLAAVPALTAKMKATVQNSRLMRKIADTKLGGKYLNDMAFRGGLSIYQGMTVNFFYVIFRIASGIRYRSAWFISMAVYYLVLGGMRALLVFHYRRGDKEQEIRCYRRIAWLLFLLNIPMGGMIVLMVKTNSGYSYPGYVIYISALYTFYSMTMSIVNVVKFRALGSPLLSAAKVLNFVSAMMSILGLQTAMIARFSQNGEDYRKMMNAITGGFVWGIVILVATYMLFRSRKAGKEADTFESL